MNILYDYQIFNLQRYGGISRYICEIAKRIALYNDVYLFEGYHINKYGLENEKQIKKCFSKKRLPIKYTGWIFRYLNRNMIKSFIENLSIDIYHPTYYENLNLNNGKLVVTVHDMIHELYGINDGTILKKKNIIEKADGIICVSEWTKRDLVNILSVDEKKIQVIHLANSLDIEVMNAPLIIDPYILYVGNRGGYKNFNKFLEAFSQSKFKDDLICICFGGGNFNSNEIRLIKKYGLQNRIKLLSGEDKTLANLYKNAEIFVFPSLYEGFGIPPLEAMHYGTPVIASNAASIPEVVGDAGIYFNADNVDDMTHKIDMVLNDNELQRILAQKGKDREKMFSWDKCASNTIEFYKKVVNGGTL